VGFWDFLDESIGDNTKDKSFDGLPTEPGLHRDVKDDPTAWHDWEGPVAEQMGRAFEERGWWPW
jgi:hypothetical protein